MIPHPHGPMSALVESHRVREPWHSHNPSGSCSAVGDATSHCCRFLDPRSPFVSASCGQQLVMFDAQEARFRSIKLRPKQAGCAVCGEKPSVTRLVDYQAFCGCAATDKVGHK